MRILSLLSIMVLISCQSETEFPNPENNFAKSAMTVPKTDWSFLDDFIPKDRTLLHGIELNMHVSSFDQLMNKLELADEITLVDANEKRYSFEIKNSTVEGKVWIKPIFTQSILSAMELEVTWDNEKIRTLPYKISERFFQVLGEPQEQFFVKGNDPIGGYKWEENAMSIALESHSNHTCLQLKYSVR